MPQPLSFLGLCLSQNLLLTLQSSQNPAPQLSLALSAWPFTVQKNWRRTDDESGAILSELPWVLQICPARWNHAEGLTHCLPARAASLSPSLLTTHCSPPCYCQGRNLSVWSLTDGSLIIMEIVPLGGHDHICSQHP